MIIFIVCINYINAQSFFYNDSLSNLVAIAKVKKDEVVIRWAPKNHIAWNRGNISGYKVLRYRVNFEGKKPVEVTKVGNDTIKPLTLEKWKEKFPEDHPYAPVAVQALYGEKFQVKEKELDIFSARTISQEQELRYSIALYLADIDYEVADALGLRVVDKTIEKNEQYLYLIIPYDTSVMDTAQVFVDTRYPAEIPKAPPLEKNEMENRIELRWNNEQARFIFTAYWIERSKDGVNWQRLNSTPFLSATQNSDGRFDKYAYYIDTTISRNYEVYKYRLIGITSFGELSEPSDVIEAMGRDRTPPPSPVIKSIKDIGGKFKLEWELNNPPKDLKGFLVGRSDKITGDYSPITKDFLPPNTNTFIDDSPSFYGENYYVVYASDTANNFSASLPVYGFIVDSIPPAKPKGLKGTIDSSGIVKLTWLLGDEPDIIGYRVYYANRVDHEFSNLTPYPLRDTVFIDTINLNTLTKEIFYQVVAVDRNYNHSERSDILRLVKPDIVPPVSPLISDYTVTDSMITIQVITSSSDDVAEHILLRKGENDKDWVRLQSVKGKPIKGTQTFVDKNFAGSSFYYYTVQALDSTGNKSEFAPPIGIKILVNNNRFKIKRLEATYDKEKKIILLNWEKLNEPVKYYVIFRKVNGDNFENYSSVEPDKTTFVDKDLIFDGEYQYAIKSISSSGESEITLSNKIKVMKGE